jgi:two-component system, NtrC family, response regulator AtoC
MRIAIVDDEAIVRSRLQRVLAKDGFEVENFGSGEEFLDRVKSAAFDLILLDVVLPGMNGIEVLRHVKSHCADTEVILITGFASIDAAIEATKLGAFHYVSKPFKLDEIRHLTQKALEHKRLVEENSDLRARLESCEERPEMIGVSSVMQEVFGVIDKVAPLDCNVIIQGESGTGKELVARAIHRQSRRRDRPFVAFNCGGFTEELISSELFGYERGAFTGATATKLGILETAHGGTVFMDEIGDMPLSMQGRLLRVLQERQIQRVGANKPIQLDLRFIAATNKDLRRAVEEGSFREDLYFRLKVVQIVLPSLAERKEDIPLLIRHLMLKHAQRFAKKVTGLAPEARDILLRYAYPGNVRELENIMERAVALAEGPTITPTDLPPDLREYSVTSYGKWPTLEIREKDYIEKVLKFTHYNVGQTADMLDLPRTTLWRKMKKYGLAKPS